MSRPESRPEGSGPNMADAKEFQVPQARGPKALLCTPQPCVRPCGAPCQNPPCRPCGAPPPCRPGR